FEGTIAVPAASGLLSTESDPGGDPLTVSLTSQPPHGTVNLNADGSFTYTAATGFHSDDSFLYIVSDSHAANIQSTATIHVLSCDALVALTLQLTRPDGTPLATLSPGDDFVPHVFAQDDNPIPHGVFAAYLDVTWDSTRAIATGPIQYSSDYSHGHDTMTAASGLIDEGGAFAGLNELGGGPHEVFSIPMRATKAGLLAFTA